MIIRSLDYKCIKVMGIILEFLKSISSLLTSLRVLWYFNKYFESCLEVTFWFFCEWNVTFLDKARQELWRKKTSRKPLKELREGKISIKRSFTMDPSHFLNDIILWES